jgi:RsiW-degrading membrane proteinase PrsW (M82 family)
MSQAHGPAGPTYAGPPARPAIPPAVRKYGPRGVVFAVLVSIALVLGALVMGLVLIASGEPGAIGVGFVLATLPVGPLVAAYFWLDRYEPEPTRLLVVAFAWGALVATGAALVVQTVDSMLNGSSEQWSAIVTAPVTEEAAKGFFVLLLLWLRRHVIDGLVDALVYAGLVGVGFAFTENILYFGRAIAESSTPGSDLVQIFFLRGVMSPFAHAIFTGTTGLIMGLAARRWHSGVSVLAFFVGLVPAMILHNRWNSMGQDFLAQYVLVQVPIFLFAVACIVVLRVAETRLTRQRLQEYAAAGWFAPAEVELLATPGGRRQAVRWAGSYNRGDQMKEFVKAATRLAFTRQRILSGRDVPSHQQDEVQQLRHLTELRAAVQQ